MAVQAALPGRGKRIQKLYNPLSKSSLFQHSQFLLKLVREALSTFAKKKRLLPFMVRSPNGSLSHAGKLAQTFCTSCTAFSSVRRLSLLSIPPTPPHHSAPRPKRSSKDIFPLLSSLVFQMPHQIPVSPNANNVNMPFFPP